MPETNFQHLKDLNKSLILLKSFLQDPSIVSMPQWLTIESTRVCNLQCPHCQTHGTPEIFKENNSKKYNMEPGLLRRLTGETLPFAFEYAISSNGEVFAFKGIENIIKEFSSYGAKLSVVTNGTLLSKEIIENVLPYASNFAISIDGATEKTFEILRRGAHFKKVIRNIKILKRTIELLSMARSVPLSISFTIMGSNIHELPGMVRFADFLEIPVISGSFVVIFYDNISHEDMGFHKPRYNYYRTKAMTLAEKLGVALRVPPPFNDTASDPNLDPVLDKLIIEEIPNTEPEPIPYENYISLKEVEKTAAALTQKIKKNILKIKPREMDESTKKTGKRLQESYRRLLDKKETIHSQYNERIDEQIKYCIFLSQRMFIDINGNVTPCCIMGVPILGNIYKNSVFEIFNGEQYNEFRERFQSSDPYPCCKNCCLFQHIKLASFLNINDTLNKNTLNSIQGGK